MELACVKARFAAVSDGPPQRIRDKGQQHLPGDGLVDWRTQDVGREEILSCQPAGDKSANLLNVFSWGRAPALLRF
jgi:hypothetical protein